MSLKGLLNSTCTIQSLATVVDRQGTVRTTYTTGTQVACRVYPVRQPSETHGAARPLVVGRFRFGIVSPSTITETQRIVRQGVSYEILQAAPIDGYRNFHHWEIEAHKVI